jgi:hypothetical protein
MKSFKLVNPYIIGEMNTEYKAENGLDAAKQFWNDFSAYLINDVKGIYITLQSGGELSHYKISEHVAKGKKLASYTIEEHKVNVDDKLKKDFLNEIKKLESKEGGKHTTDVVRPPKRDSSDSSSSSSSDSDSDNYFNYAKYRHLRRPISFYWYTPYLYRVARIYTPTFNAPVAPYSQLWIPWNAL